MPVTSSTIGGIACWQFSGVVTDAELKTAWAGLVVNNRYKPGRAIYLDSTADISGVRGSFYVDCEAHGIILHSARNKAKTVFNNFELTQTVGLPVANRSQFVRVTDGTNVTNSSTDGIDMKGGAMIYAVVGSPPSGDPRYLNEMIFGSLDGTLVTSAAFTLQEIEPRSIGSIWRRLSLQKVSAFPILEAVGGLQRQVVYSSTINTEGISSIIRPYYNNSVCLVSCLVRRNGNIVTNNLVNTFGSNGSAVVMILNTWLDETFFGVSKTNFIVANWSAGNRVIGGVLKKLKVLPSTIIKVYDSRSTTTPAKSTFSETTQDYLTGTTFTTADATTGNASIVHVGGIATGSGAPITRYTNQRFTLQLFGYKVEVKTPDMTFGDDDLSAFSPITMTVQDGLARTQAAINAATVLTSFQDLLEELHVLAIGLSGSASYAGAFGGNLFTFAGGVLTTSFAAVNVDATAAAKISFDSATNVLTVKASELTDNATVTKWVNATGTINLLNGATIKGIYQSGTVTSARLTLEGPTDTSIRVSTNTGAEYDFASDIDATYVEYFGPGKTGIWTWIAERLGKQRQSGTFTPGVGGDFVESLIWLDDLGLTETNAAVLAAITDFGDPNQVLNYAAYWRTTQAGIAINKISKDGNAVSWGDANVNWVASAAVPLAYDAATNTFTAVTTGHVAGATLFSHRTTGLMTFGAGTNFNTAFKDVDGLRVSVTGLNPQGFTLTGHLRYRKQGTTAWTTTTYTANTITLLMEEAIYDVQVRCPGYDWKTTEVDAAKTLLLDVGLQFQVSSNNTPQYTMPFNAVLEAIFSYDPPSMQVAVANTTGGILQPGFAELYQATQRIMHLPSLVWTWTNPIKANATSQKIIIPTGNPLQMFLTAASNASVKLTCPVIHEDNGQSADDRVRGNASGYSIILGSPATAESAGLQAAIVADILAATLKANIIQVNDVPVSGTGAEGDEWGPST